MASQVMKMSAPENEEPVEGEQKEVQTKPLAEGISPIAQREIAPEESPLQNKTIQRDELTENKPEEEDLVAQKSPAPESIQRDEATAEEKPQEDLPVQAKAESEGKSSNNGNLESQLNGSKGGGSPLPGEVRAFMEPRFGADFSGVRVHTDSSAVQMNKELGAQAFAHGNDIYYGAGKSPGKDELTAHELTHTVQQGGGGQLKKPAGQQGNQDIDGVAVSLTPLVQQNVIAPRIQCWVLPLDWLDYIGLAADVAERIYIELGYEEGQEKDFRRFVNNLFIAIDVVFAATPGAGGGGLALRVSHSAGVAAWAATPNTIKLRIAEEVAKRMGWSVTRALQAANVYFTMSSNGEGERRNVESHENEGGHTEERHVGKSENWLRNRLQNEPDIPMASSFRNEAIANRTQGQFVKQFREQIEAWLKSGQGKPFVRDFDMGEPVGIVVERGRNGAFQPAVQTTRAQVVIVRDNSERGWHILTSFPIK